MIYIQIALLILAIFVAINGLYGDTSDNGVLNKRGRVIRGTILIVFFINITLVIYQEIKKIEEEISLVKAKSTIYGRTAKNLETLKFALHWKAYDFQDPLQLSFDHQATSTAFMNPNSEGTIDIDNIVTDPIRSSIRQLSLIYNHDRTYLKFEEADLLGRALDSMDEMDLYKTVSRYRLNQGIFSTYLIENDVNKKKLIDLILILDALEKKINNSRVINTERYYELLPECEGSAHNVKFDC